MTSSVGHHSPSADILSARWQVASWRIWRGRTTWLRSMQVQGALEGSSGELQVLRYPELRQRRIPIHPVSLFFFSFKTSLVTDPPNEKWSAGRGNGDFPVFTTCTGKHSMIRGFNFFGITALSNLSLPGLKLRSVVGQQTLKFPAQFALLIVHLARSSGTLVMVKAKE